MKKIIGVVMLLIALIGLTACSPDMLGISDKISTMGQFPPVEESDYFTVACVLRNNGSGWHAITYNHQPVGVDSVENDNSKITVHFMNTGSAVIVAMADEDDVLCGQFGAGISCGFDEARIYIRDSDGNLVNPNDITTEEYGAHAIWVYIMMVP